MEVAQFFILLIIIMVLENKINKLMNYLLLLEVDLFTFLLLFVMNHFFLLFKFIMVLTLILIDSFLFLFPRWLRFQFTNLLFIQNCLILPLFVNKKQI